MQRRHPSPLCPLCGERDKAEHFVSCGVLSNEARYKVLEDEKSHFARKHGYPNDVINTARQVMVGVYKSPKRQKERVRRAYREQQKIGWDHFRKGRLTKVWGETGIRGDLDRSATAYISELAAILLQWLGDKWKLRCKLVRDYERTAEKQRVYNKGAWTCGRHDKE